MTPFPWPALLAAAGVLLGLEVVYLLLRPSMPGRLLRLRFQLLAACVAVLTLYAVAEALPSKVFDVAAFVALVLAVELAYRVLDRLWLGRDVDARGRPLAPKLVRELGAVLVVFAAVVVAAHLFLDVPYARFLLPSAVVSAVLGLALQDVLKNVFAGLALQTEMPFTIGDWLLLDGDTAQGMPMQVVEISLRSTHLRSPLGVHVREPNSELLASRIVNLGAGLRPVGFAVQVGVAYGSPPALVKRSLEQAALDSPGVVAEPAPVALVREFADSAVVYELRFWTRDVHRMARQLDAVRTRIWYQLQRDGWKIPFPIRTVQVEPAHRVEADRRDWRRSRAADLLERLDLFAALEPEVRRRLAESAELRYYDAGEVLVREGEEESSLMVLARGTVEVSARGEGDDGAELPLATLGEGESFGEMSLLTGEPRSATVTARTACEVFVLRRDDLAPILQEDPRVAEVLSRMLAERRASTTARLEDRRERAPRVVHEEERSLLDGIRRFFRLG